MSDHEHGQHDPADTGGQQAPGGVPASGGAEPWWESPPSAATEPAGTPPVPPPPGAVPPGPGPAGAMPPGAGPFGAVPAGAGPAGAMPPGGGPTAEQPSTSPGMPPPPSPYPGAAYPGGAYPGPAPGGPYGPVPPPGGWAHTWGQPPPPPPPPAPRHRTIPATLAALLVLIAAAAGVGIGHAAWQPASTINAAADNPGGSAGPGAGPGGQSPFGPGDGTDNPYGPYGPYGGSGNGGGGSGSGSGAAPSNEGRGGPADVKSIATKAAPSLVDINTTLSQPGAEAAGTGIVLTADGEVLTNNHVIDGSTKITATDVGNGHTYRATVVGYDSTHDIAVIQLQNASGLATAKLGDSSKVSVGQAVVGIGNAGGAGGTPSSAGGSITALHRSITATDQLDGSSEQLSNLIQMNAPIQAGDSGGALVDSSGRVIGVDTAASQNFSFASSASQGFAIPINDAMAIVRAIDNGQASATVHLGPTAFLGVQINPRVAQGGGFGGFGGGSLGVSGVPIEGVVPGTAAENAGLQPGDVITALGSRSVGSATALTKALVPYHPGDRVQLGWVDSSGQSHTATVQLGNGPAA